MSRSTLLPIFVASLALFACKNDRVQLEQLVPDGATGLVSFDAKAFSQTELFAKLKAGLEGAGDAKGKAVIEELRDSCKLDLDQVQSMVLGFDALSQNMMGAIRMPNLGTAEALRCADALVTKQRGNSLWTVGEVDGKVTVTVSDGEGQGWALDSNTLVLSSKGWASAVEARMKGESKSAVDHNLAEAVALADRSKQLWGAGEIPPLVAPFLESTPAKGIRRAAGSVHYGDGLEIAVSAAFGDEAAAKAAHDQLAPMIEEGKTLAVAGGLSRKSADSLVLEVKGAVLAAKVSVEVEPLLEATIGAFSTYIRRSKSAEARVNVAKMFDAAAEYFQEERVSRAEVAVLGAGGALTGPAPHRCPNDGSSVGEAGITPPLSVDCSKGPGGRCTPVAGEPSGPGEYPMALWTDNPVWNAMNFQQELGHAFHYNFKWANEGEGHGSCMFTAQAFGDLDGDAVFSTYERAGAGDRSGINGAAGLYIDRELE